MLCRSTRLDHPLGVSIETPLLIPSLSSKGLGISKEGESEVKNIFSVVSEYLTDTMLISAYDLSYGYLEPIDSAITEIAFVDSGGYEISDFQDLSAVYRHAVSPQDWSEERLRDVYDRWPKHVPAVFVSFDHPDIRQPLKQQIVAARRLFSGYRHQLNTLLIKPETGDQLYVQINNVVAQVEELRSFNIIGVTEVELGYSILNRMQNIAALRLAMDDAGINKPIHIYGSLDPITSILYFLAGAEIFDGLTWLRYGYAEGLACYRNNYSVRAIGIRAREAFIKAMTMRNNLSYLLDLTDQMRKFLLDSDFERFGNNARDIRAGYELLLTRNKRA